MRWGAYLLKWISGQVISNNRQQIAKNEKLEDQNCWRIKAKDRPGGFHQVHSSDSIILAVFVQWLEEKRISMTMRYWKAKIDCYCISVEVPSSFH